jgi:LacI family transcriptional regulator, galactose operon repressor
VAVSATRPTMRDVAQRAGVSLKTVSRVINDEAGVAAETAARVSDAIAALGFQRNDLARSLRHGRSSATVGLIIEDVANPFYSAVAQAVETAARERGLMLITASCEEDPEREREMVTALLRRRVDALLVVPAGREHRWLQDAAAGTPVVFVDRPPQDIEADTVLLDDVGGARKAVEHLIAHGHRRIAYASDAGAVWTARERFAGYTQAHEAAGIPVDDSLVRRGTHRADEAEAVVTDLLSLPEQERPTALFTANNRNTVGALRALSQTGGQTALVGFDDFELADLLGASVVRFEYAALGRQAAALAFGRLDGDEGPPQRIVVPTELVARGSGERRP